MGMFDDTVYTDPQEPPNTMAIDQIASKTPQAPATKSLTQRLRRGISSTKTNASDGDTTGTVGSKDARRLNLTKSPAGLQAKIRAPLKGPRSNSDQEIDGLAISSNRMTFTLADLFFALPHELKIQILCELSFSDILTLRVTSRSFALLVTASQSPIVRYYTKHSVPSHVLSVYPPPSPSNARLSYLLGLRYRLNICSSLAGLLADFFTAENFGHGTASGRQKFEPQRNRMQKRMVPLLLVLFHFLEKYRAALAKHLLNTTVSGQIADRNSSKSLQIGIISSYSPRTLLPIHEMYRLLLRSFSRNLRPPSYAGRLERSVRGWKKPPPSETELTKVFLVGGLPEINKIFQGQNYAEKRRRMEDFVRKIDSRQGRTLLGTSSTSLSRNSSSDGYLHTRSFQRAFESRTESTSGTGRCLGEVLLGPHLSILDLWISPAEVSLLAAGTVSSFDQSPNEFINGLAGEVWDKGVAELGLDDLTLTSKSRV